MKIDAPEAFALTPSERQSALWGKLLAHFEDKLRDARGRNDGDHGVKATNNIRGQIGTLKALIDLDKEPPVLE